MHLCINPAMHLQYVSMRIFVFGSKRSKHDPRTKNPTQLQLAPRPCIQRVLNDSSPYPQEHGKNRLREDLLANTVRRCKRLPKSTKILLVLPQLHHAISRAPWHPAQSTNSTQGARHEIPWAHFNESTYFKEPRDCCGSWAMVMDACTSMYFAFKPSMNTLRSAGKPSIHLSQRMAHLLATGCNRD